ncbi:MAG: hypothetical protein GQ570_06225 [Helicobacteraceae bacterium]|nr:hypothetical protein [Helicobacteraceae bacterium]
MNNYQNYAGFGIAGNFALHLEQAGELEDFKDLEVADENGPKGMFPFYLEANSTQLGVYPLSDKYINLPSYEANVQAEPEVGLICEVEYENEKVVKITPKYAAPYNDCSIRREGAKKISHKKNWGENSKGLGSKLIELDSFSKGGVLDTYRIASFMIRDGKVIPYGEDTEVVGYSYFHEKLTSWMINQFQTQVDVGPLEPISEYLKEANCPKEFIISIGATRYTEFGEKNFLKAGDDVVIVLYNGALYRPERIEQKVFENSLDVNGISALIQRVQ